MSEPSVLSEVDALFKLPLGEFTAARNALAAQLKKAGREAEASEVKTLVKPSASAWAVNQLYWRHRELFARLIDAGEALRRAHAAKLAGDAAREPVNARRKVMAELSAIAERILREGDHSATRDVMRRVTATLEALSSSAALTGAPVAGRLTDDLEPPGFDVFAGLMPDRGKGAAGGAQLQIRLPHAEPATKSAARDRADAARRDKEARSRLVVAAKAAVREAERNANAARKQVERAKLKAEAAAKRAKEADGERAELEKRLAQARKEAEAAHTWAHETGADSEAAARAADAAERALELARARLQQLVADKS